MPPWGVAGAKGATGVAAPTNRDDTASAILVHAGGIVVGGYTIPWILIIQAGRDEGFAYPDENEDDDDEDDESFAYCGQLVPDTPENQYAIWCGYTPT